MGESCPNFRIDMPLWTGAPPESGHSIAELNRSAGVEAAANTATSTPDGMVDSTPTTTAPGALEVPQTLPRRRDASHVEVFVASQGPSQAGSSNLDSCSYVAIDVLPESGHNIDGMPASSVTSTNSRMPSASPTTGSIWTRLKRHGQWVSSRMNMSTESLEEGAGSSAGSPDQVSTGTLKGMPRKQNKRPRSATMGTHSERILPRRTPGANEQGEYVPTVNHQLTQRTRRWVGSTQQINAVDRSDALADDDTESEIQMLRLMADENRRQESEAHEEPTDYLQSTMKDLFNREKRTAGQRGGGKIRASAEPSDSPYNSSASVGVGTATTAATTSNAINRNSLSITAGITPHPGSSASGVFLPTDMQAGPSGAPLIPPPTMLIGSSFASRQMSEEAPAVAITASASPPEDPGPDVPVQTHYLSLKDALLTRAGNAIPVVQPTGVEPPDLSASSLNFETGGMLPEKYLAGPAASRITTEKMARKPSRRRARSDSVYANHDSGPDTIDMGPMSIWEAFQRPLSESPSTTWTLTFPRQIESLYRIWLFHLWMKPFQFSVIALLAIFWIGWVSLEWALLSNDNTPVHIGSCLCLLMCLVGLWWSRQKSWERWWYRFMFFTFCLMAAESLNISTFDTFAMPLDQFKDQTYSVMIPTNTVRIIFFQTAISGFAQLPFYQIAIILWAFTIGQIAIEATGPRPSLDPSLRPLFGNWLLYFACSIVGTYFRYAGEVHLRKAFIKYRIAYRNQERLFAAREQSEYLLSMILPAKVIETLHNLQGKVSDRLILSTHETFMELHGVTIMFADLVGFTEFSASITADTLVQVLSELFSAFDSLVTEFGLETIKTIGDCIQIAGGVPEQLESDEEIANQAERVCVMSLIMLSTTTRISASIGRNLKLRIGIHTGTVIGGVMGLWKFKYDIWSRDVDIASLIEQTGKTHVPHVSHTTYMHLQKRPGLMFEPAQTISAFGRSLPTYDVVVLQDGDERLETLAERLRIREGAMLEKGSKVEDAGSSGEAVTAAAVRQAIGASGPLVFNDLPNPMGRGTPVISKGKNNIGVMVKNFSRSIRIWSCAFKDEQMEEDYRDNYVRNWPGAMILSSCGVFICYLCMFGVHLAVFSNDPKATFIVEGVLGVVLLALILFAHRLNRPLRRETIIVTDKGDRLASALWMTSAEEISQPSHDPRRPSALEDTAGGPVIPGTIPAARAAKKIPHSGDRWRWFRPNTFALSTIFILFLANMIHFTQTNSEATKYHSGGMAITIICGLVYPGIRIHFVNVLLVIMTFTFLAAILGTFQEASHIVPPLLVLAAALRANRSYDIISRMNFYIKLQTERDYRETKNTQAAAERMLLNILPLNVVQLRSTDDATEIENIWTLNDIICDIDALARSRSVEKIKTIGTKYMAMAETVPDVPEHHLERLCDFALDLADVVSAFNARSGQSFGLRGGIHIGPAVCGLIGTKTFTFDVWGDTVNVASRMESTQKGEGIQVTEEVYERLKHRYVFTDQQTVFVKGKGDMRTRFLKSRTVVANQKNQRERRISMMPPPQWLHGADF
ncbi:Adenylate cyclase type 1 [Geranomyces michiganensis]|nr:Adenylate cyclase type 1 [Geranomyces michiganensis]